MANGFLSRVEEPLPPRPSGPRIAPTDRYAAAAFQDEIRKVENAADGERNHVLVAAAFSLKSLVNAGTLDEFSVTDALTDAARTAGLDEGEIAPTIRSGFRGADAKVGARTVSERPLVSLPQSSLEERPAPTPEGGTSPSKLEARLLTPTGLRNLPEPKPLIDNVLDQGTTALLYGKWASSKSFIALDWGCSVATGRPWQARETERARVLYVVAEGVAGFAGRLDAWEVGWQSKIEDGWMRFLPMPVNLMTRDVDTLTDVVSRGGYGFIILDTLARCMVGGDENAARDAGIVIDALTQLMYATPKRRGVVLGVHHTGKDGRTLRGSSAFESGVDTVYFTERDGQAVTLRRTKRKDGPESDVHTLRLSNITGTASCVIESLSGENGVSHDAQSVALLRKLFSDLFSITGVPNTELRTLAIDSGMSQATFYRARAELLKEGWLINTGTGARAYFEMASQSQD